jgi:lupus La protein
MKIKEKGLTGKAAEVRKDLLAAPSKKGFNAFREMAKEKAKSNPQSKGDGDKAKAKPEIYLEFMGQKLKVSERDGDGDGDSEGAINEADFTTVPRASMKFTGCGGECDYSEVKVRSLLTLFYLPLFSPSFLSFLSSRSPLRSPLITLAGPAARALRARALHPVRQGRRWRSAGLRQAAHRRRDRLRERKRQDDGRARSDVDALRRCVRAIPNPLSLLGRRLTRASTEEEERAFQLARAQHAAARVFAGAQRSGDKSGSGRGGRGRGRGRGGRGRGGRGRGGGGGRDRGGDAKETNGGGKGKEAEKEEKEGGEKRKRDAVEPDGGPYTGTRGAGVPVVQSAAKKAKVEPAPVASAAEP